MNTDELARLIADHRLFRKLLPTLGSYGPTLSSRPPPHKGPDGKPIRTPPYWWCKTCKVEFEEEDERSWAEIEAGHQASIIGDRT